ncbi:MAG: hypothetical protein Q8S13_10175 [Dehalococcoidia bacterium]|nr:hypothetical protein [Dehalococcoidia bacterium]
MMAAASRKQASILAVLLVVMAAVYARAFRRPGPAAVSSTATDQGAASVRREPGPDPELASRRVAQRVALEQLTWERDPFSRGPARGHGELTLSGILWDAARPIAIINGETLQPGEEIDGFRIVSIEPTRVVVTDGTQTLQLQIVP